MKIKKFLVAAAVALLIAGSQVPSLNAATTWSSNASANWTDASKWSGGVPGSTSDAVMAATAGSITLTVNTTVTVGTLAFSNSNNNDVLSIGTGGSLSIASGTVSGTGSLYIQQTNSGVANSVLTADASVSNIQVFGGTSGTTAYFTTVNGQDLTATSSSLTVGNSNGSGVFTLSTGSTLAVQQYLILTGNGTNGATFNLSGGTLKLRGGGSGFGIRRQGSASSANFNFNSGTITSANTSNVTFSSTDTNSAKLDIALGNSGTREINVATASQVFTLQSTARLVDQAGVQGGWTKTGSGQVVLQGNNTYTGDTVVSDGTLVLDTTGSLAFKIGANGVSNKIYDDAGANAKITLDGQFVFDLSGANTTVGNSWTIVDLASFSSSSTFFGGNFTVASLSGNFTHAGNLWTQSIAGSTYYQFSEATGQLTVVPEPATWMLLAAGLTVVVVFRRRRTA